MMTKCLLICGALVAILGSGERLQAISLGECLQKCVNKGGTGCVGCPAECLKLREIQKACQGVSPPIIENPKLETMEIQEY